MRASVRLLFLFLFSILTSRVWAQTGQAPNSLVPDNPSHLPRFSETVAMHDLLIPPKAVKELRRSQNALQLGDTRSSALHLARALKIYPNYLEGHNSLGARYIELHEYEKAAAEFQKAIDINPRVMQPVNNLSVALFLERRYVDAEAAARRAHDLDPHDPTARYMLGAILATEDRNPAEAMEMLLETKNQFPDARLLLAQIFERSGDERRAERELRDYLAVPDAEKRQNVERWLLRLAQKSTANSTTETKAP